MAQLRQISEFVEGTGAIPAETYVNNFVLAANVPETFAVPTGATHCIFAANTDIWVRFFGTGFPTEIGVNGKFAEYVGNGGFDDETIWTAGTGWAIGSGVATATTSSAALSQTIATLEAGRAYTVTYTVTRTAGSVKISLGGTAGTARSTNATFSEVITCGATTTLAITGTGFSGTVDDVKISAWTLGVGWTIASDKASSDGTQTGASLLVQTPSSGLVEGQNYYVTYTVTRSAGTITPFVGGTNGTARSTAATFSEIIKAGSGTTIGFSADADFVGTVDDVTFVPCAQVPVTDNITGNGSVLNPTIRFIGNTASGTGAISNISIISASATLGNIAFYTKP
jgi:hypothetical protein